MLNDLTFGQYFPANSLIHRLDPRLKFVLLVFCLVLFLFFNNNYYTLGLCVAFVFLVLLLSKIPLKMYLKNMKIILPVLLFTAVLNMLYVKTGRVLLNWWIFEITSDGLNRALFFSLRVVLLILISATLTYTVTPNDLSEALERLLSPLRFVGLGSAVYVLSMMMTIALRFIPILVEETGKIMNAQKSRGADLESGGLTARIKALVPILIPLFVLSIRRSYDLAEAMECRCYNGGKGRKRMKQMTLHRRDYLSLLAVLLFSAVLIYLFYTSKGLV